MAALICCVVSLENSVLRSPPERVKTAIVSGGRYNRRCNRHMADAQLESQAQEEHLKFKSTIEFGYSSSSSRHQVEVASASCQRQGAQAGASQNCKPSIAVARQKFSFKVCISKWVKLFHGIPNQKGKRLLCLAASCSLLFSSTSSFLATAAALATAATLATASALATAEALQTRASSSSRGLKMHFFSCHEMHSSSVKSRMCDGRPSLSP